jgi:hypothetical protein
VRDAVAVEVADLLAADGEAVLAAAADAGLDARPGGDLVGDDLAGAACLRGGHALHDAPRAVAATRGNWSYA